MPHFEATVRVFDVMEPDALAARRAVEERLRAAGFSRCHVVTLGLQRAATPAVPVPRSRRLRADASYAGGGIVVAAVVGWAMWFLWLLLG